MKINIKLFYKHMHDSLFKSEGTPGRLTPKRLLFVLFIFFANPIWAISLRTAYLLDNIFYRVRTLHQKFPDAKFINIVRNPLKVIPSSVSMFSSHWQAYGDPKDEYALQDTMNEQGKHWYLYPHQYLKHLPSDQYVVVRYRDLERDPQGTIEAIYRQFGMRVKPGYRKILIREAEKSRGFKSKHKYSLREMGLSRRRIAREFLSAEKQYNFNLKDNLANADKSA